MNIIMYHLLLFITLAFAIFQEYIEKGEGALMPMQETVPPAFSLEYENCIMVITPGTFYLESSYTDEFEVAEEKPQNSLRLQLKYDNEKPAIKGLKRVSKPGLRVQVQRAEIPRAYGGLGISIISTSRGVMTGKEAWKKGLGGELWAYVW